MIFVALLVTLRASPAQRTSSQEPFSLSLLGRDLLMHVLPSYEKQEAAQETDKLREQYAVAHLKNRDAQEMLRITFWGERAADDAATLVSHCMRHPLVGMGLHRYTITSVCLAQHPEASLATWTDLMLPRTSRVLVLRFLSPTTFQEASVTQHNGLDFPEPRVVFSQLWSRWRDLRGPPLNLLPSLEQDGCVVADYQLRTHHQGLPSGIQRGWVGWLRYECRISHHESIAAINSLARLACFTGTGFVTEQGMGFTRFVVPEERR